MRTITRNVLLVILGVVVALLALGALPGFLRSGDPYYMTATAVDGEHTAVTSSTLSERRFEYTFGALSSVADGGGRSDPYWKGPFGIKGAFTHSPFDEVSGIGTRYPNATDGDAFFVHHDGAVYRLEVSR